MAFRKLAIVLTAAMMLCMAFMSLAPTASASPGDLHIFSPTVTNMEVEMDSSVTYRWGVYNNGTNPQTLLIDIHGTELGWDARLSNEDAYFVLAPGEFISLELNVTAPNTRDYPEDIITLNATARDLVTQEQWVEEFGTVTTTIVGGAYVPPTKVLGWFDDPLGNYVPALDNEWGVFISTILVWLIIGAVIYFILGPSVKAFTSKTETELDDQILAIVKGPVFWIILTYGIISSLEVLNFSWSIVHALETFYSVTLIILFCWMGFKIFKDVLISWGKKYAEKSETTLDDVLLPLFEKVGMVAIVVVAIIAILNLFGVDVTLLMAGMGVVGLVIAFAAQDTLGNFISGMFLLTDRPFKVGDLILMDGGDYCRVEHIGMRSTKLYNTFDHDMIIVPNNKIANEKVTNLTLPDTQMKVQVEIGVDYKSDIKKAKQIMLDAANNNSGVIKDEDKKPFVRLTEFEESAIKLKLFAWVYELDSQWRVGGELREEILTQFRAEGIDIPFPQRVLHFENGESEMKNIGIRPTRVDK
jgi:MscS family membrane protein